VLIAELKVIARVRLECGHEHECTTAHLMRDPETLEKTTRRLHQDAFDFEEWLWGMREDGGGCPTCKASK